MREFQLKNVHFAKKFFYAKCPSFSVESKETNIKYSFILERRPNKMNGACDVILVHYKYGNIDHKRNYKYIGIIFNLNDFRLYAKEFNIDSKPIKAFMWVLSLLYNTNPIVTNHDRELFDKIIFRHNGVCPTTKFNLHTNDEIRLGFHSKTQY